MYRNFIVGIIGSAFLLLFFQNCADQKFSSAQSSANKLDSEISAELDLDFEPGNSVPCSQVGLCDLTDGGLVLETDNSGSRDIDENRPGTSTREMLVNVPPTDLQPKKPESKQPHQPHSKDKPSFSFKKSCSQFSSTLGSFSNQALKLITEESFTSKKSTFTQEMQSISEDSVKAFQEFIEFERKSGKTQALKSHVDKISQDHVAIEGSLRVAQFISQSDVSSTQEIWSPYVSQSYVQSDSLRFDPANKGREGASQSYLILNRAPLLNSVHQSCVDVSNLKSLRSSTQSYVFSERIETITEKLHQSRVVANELGTINAKITQSIIVADSIESLRKMPNSKDSDNIISQSHVIAKKIGDIEFGLLQSKVAATEIGSFVGDRFLQSYAYANKIGKIIVRQRGDLKLQPLASSDTVEVEIFEILRPLSKSSVLSGDFRLGGGKIKIKNAIFPNEQVKDNFLEWNGQNLTIENIEIKN